MPTDLRAGSSFAKGVKASVYSFLASRVWLPTAVIAALEQLETAPCVPRMTSQGFLLRVFPSRGSVRDIFAGGF